MDKLEKGERPTDSSAHWFEDDEFWSWTHDVLFHENRLKEAPAHVDSLLKLVTIPEGGSVLDLCCGPGRHSLEFARRGFRVTGVDRTRAYLETARTQAHREGVAVEFALADMRDFCRPDSFDAAVNLYTSFGYFANRGEDRQVLQNLHASLSAGGVLVIDLLGKEVLARIFRPRDWSRIEGVGLFLEERTLAPDWSHLTARWTIIRERGRREFPLRLRLYSGVELADLLESCGFRDVTLYGSFAGGPYDSTAQRLIAVARK